MWDTISDNYDLGAQSGLALYGDWTPIEDDEPMPSKRILEKLLWSAVKAGQANPHQQIAGLQVILHDWEKEAPEMSQLTGQETPRRTAGFKVGFPGRA